MSGHSKWSQIKHKKSITDAKKSKIFSKIARMISIAARTDKNPETNPKLRLAIEKARSFNMPKENIEKAIRKGSGQEKEKLEELIIEAFGPYGTSLILEIITDNKNRTLSEIRQILSKHNGKLASEGSVKWLFNFYGKIIVPLDVYKFEDLETMAIEFDALDIKKENNNAIILTKPEDFDRIKKNFEQQKVKIESAKLEYIPKNPIKIDETQKEEIEKLFNELDENNDVQEIYSNIENEQLLQY